MKKIITILIISTIFLFAGCSDSGGGGSHNSFELSSYNGGEKSLTGEFATNAPPEKVVDIQPFNIRVLIKNEGEYDIPDGEAFVKLSGFSPSDFGLTEEQTVKNLGAIRGFKKQRDNLIEGGTAQASFEQLKYEGNQIEGTYPQNIFVDLCHPYQTRTSAKLCVSGNTGYSIDDDAKICEVDSDMTYANSGGPIQIENIKQNAGGASSLSFQFDIIHQPQSKYAKVVELDQIDGNCKIDGMNLNDPSVYTKLNKVKYTIETGLSGISCNAENTNTGFATLVDDRATVYCTQDTTGQDEYEKPIVITLDYDYFDKLETQISIEHISQ